MFCVGAGKCIHMYSVLRYRAVSVCIYISITSGIRISSIFSSIRSTHRVWCEHLCLSAAPVGSIYFNRPPSLLRSVPLELFSCRQCDTLGISESEDVLYFGGK